MRIELPSGVPAELVRGDARRGVALCPDIGGLRPLFDDICARLSADFGWTVCAVEPFPGRESMELDERFAALAGTDDADMVARLGQAAAATGCDRVAVMGFCMGGMYSLKAAATGAYDRAVSFYGMIRVPEAWHGSGQHDAIELLRASPSPAEVLALVGTADPWTPARDVDDLEAWGAEVVRYEGAEHGFVHDPARPTFRPEAADDAWSRVADFLS